MTPKIQPSKRKQPFPACRSAPLESKAKNVIVLHSTGGPSHINVFGPKSQRANCDTELSAVGDPVVPFGPNMVLSFL